MFEPLGVAGTIETAIENLLEIYAEELEAYQWQDWTQDKKSLGAYLEKRKDDGPCMVYLDRINVPEQIDVSIPLPAAMLIGCFHVSIHLVPYRRGLPLRLNLRIFGKKKIPSLDRILTSMFLISSCRLPNFC